MAVVDDSTFVRKALTRLLGGQPDVKIVGSAESGEELLANLERWRPDVITLDLSMPGMGGLPTLDRVMALHPTPVIILSTHAGEGAPMTIEALHRGAVDFIDKQTYSLMDFAALQGVLMEKIRQVTSGEAAAAAPRSVTGARRQRSLPKVPAVKPQHFSVLLIGASTGGPPIIETILHDLQADFTLPVVIVQHMPVGFTRAFAERLNAHLPLQVREALDWDPLLPGCVYVAPAGIHILVQSEGPELYVVLRSLPDDLAHQPSVDVLFSSAARHVGERAVGVLLSGMGRDGGEGMSLLARAGAYTIAQDRDSSVVFGMPQAAISLNAAREVLPSHQIGVRLRQLVASASPPD